MSSLLSGIRFVPRVKEEDGSVATRGGDGSIREGGGGRDRRERSGGDGEDGRKDRKRDKEKKKSKKHKKDQKHKGSKRDRGLGFSSKRDRRRSSSSDSDSSDASEASRYKGEDDFKEFREELEQEQRRHHHQTGILHTHLIDSQLGSPAARGSGHREGAGAAVAAGALGGGYGNKDRFGDVDYSQGLYEYVPSDDSTSDVEHGNKDYPRDRGAPGGHNNAIDPAPSAASTKSNQSVAAMLREKLKASKAALPISSGTVASSTNDAKLHVVHDPYAIAKKLIEAKKASSSAASGGDHRLPDAKRARLGGKEEGSVAESSAPSTRDDFVRLKHAEKWDKTNMDDIFVSNVLRLGSNYKGTELGDAKSVSGGTGFDEEEDVDMKMFLSVEDRVGSDQSRDRDASRAKIAAEKREAIISKCFRCIESSNHSRDLTVSVSEHAYLRVKPSHLSLVSFGHCEIIPIEHCNSTLRAGEEALVEIGRYKSCIEAMFDREGKAVLFLESAVRDSSLSGPSLGGKSRPRVGGSSGSSGSGSMRHTVIDVVPINKGHLQEAIVYFREAFLTCDEEWSTHKKLIDLSTADPNQSSQFGRVYAKVPGHMNYVAVEWPGGGYAHVVENEEQFNEDFLLDVLSGYFQDIPYHMRRRQKNDRAKDANIVKKFKADYDMFDWVGYALDGASA